MRTGRAEAARAGWEWIGQEHKQAGLKQKQTGWGWEESGWEKTGREQKQAEHEQKKTRQ